MNPFQNHTDSPLISVILITHSGDVHLLERAVKSIAAQDTPLKQIELLIGFDGPGTEDEKDLIASVLDPIADLFYSVRDFYSDEKYGYYCVHRNRLTPIAYGIYIYNMDADNEITPNHLSGLLTAIRLPQVNGFPHFVYSRRRYITDEGATNPVPDAPTESRLVSWTHESRNRLRETPQNNFIDTGDLLISKSVLYELAARCNFIWNNERRRFGDWDLACRLAGGGFRGHAVDQISNIYHWTGKNLQTTRSSQDLIPLDEATYENLRARGLISPP